MILPMPPFDEEDYIEDIDTIVDHDEEDVLDAIEEEDFETYDEWVSRHVNEHGPTAAGFDALAQMDQEGDFT